MNDAFSRNLGVSPAAARLVRALFQFNDSAGQTRAERRRWLLALLRRSDSPDALVELERAGLLTSAYRLTWLGLTVAVNLPPLGLTLSDPLAA